jgi:hypothetical protein
MVAFEHIGLELSNNLHLGYSEAAKSTFVNTLLTKQPSKVLNYGGVER